MISSPKFRWIIIIFLTSMALLWNVPNVTKVGENWPFSKDKIVYGLDIQGGLHIVLGVSVEDVIEEKTARMSRNMSAELKERQVAFQKVQVDPTNKQQLEIFVSNEEEMNSVNKYLSDNYPATLQVLESTPQRILLHYFEAKILEYKKQVVSQAIEVIRNRIDEFGVSEPSITAQGDSRILVQLPGIKDAAKAKALINRTAKLTFQALSPELEPEQLDILISTAETDGKYELGKNELRYSKYVKRINEDLKDKLPKDTRVVFQKAPNALTLEAGKTPSLVKTDSTLTGDLLEDANVRPDEYGKPEVIFRFSVEGRRRFAEITGNNVGGYVAIILDDVIQSAPSISERIDSDTARITLGSTRNYQETMDEAQLIATALRAGALPAALEQLEERTVGPTLGLDSINRGKMAGYVGGLLVLLFMFLYYRTLGLVANVSLLLNILFLVALLTSLGATLTLPGVAGIVLTVGMAVDANVIIFERIKEEIRKGAKTQLAIRDGFKHALSAIFDANITTAAVCIVLMYFGTGPVRGFAVTLLCGIITSMFTAIFVSRTLLDFLVRKFDFNPLPEASSKA